MTDMKVDVENLLAAGVLTSMSSIVTTEVTRSATTKIVLFVQSSRVCGRTRPAPVVAIVGSSVVPVCHLSQSRSVCVGLEMKKMT